MKRLLVAILALVYLSAFTGATLRLHYCMGELAEWGFGQNQSKTCGKCGMEQANEKHNDCCRDEHKFIKNDTDQKTVEAGFQLIQSVAVALPPAFAEIPTNHFPVATEENPVSHAPHRGNGVAVYVRNCVFLI